MGGIILVKRNVIRWYDSAPFVATGPSDHGERGVWAAQSIVQPLEAMNGEETARELASRFGEDSTMIHQW